MDFWHWAEQGISYLIIAVGLAVSFGAMINHFTEFRTRMKKPHYDLVEKVEKISSQLEELPNIKSSLDRLIDEHEHVMEGMRNLCKNEIRGIWLVSSERGSISPTELDCANRLADSYFALGGNHYIHGLLDRMNKRMKIEGETIETLEVVND